MNNEFEFVKPYKKSSSNYFENFLSRQKTNKFDNSEYIRNNVELIFNDLSKSEKSKLSYLVYGEVQSGKTDNMFGVAQMAMDFQFEIIVIIGGSTTKLLAQTNSRNPLHYFVNKDKFNFLVKDDLKKNRSIQKNKFNIICLLKESGSIKLLENYLLNIKNIEKMRIAIIDDECDQASASNGEINKSLNGIYDFLHFCVYIGITATPFTNILSSSEIYNFEKIILTEKSNAYTGIEYFNENSSKYYNVVESSKSKKETWTSLITNGIQNFVINSIINSENGFNNNQLLINISEKINDHKTIIESYNDCISKEIEKFPEQKRDYIKLLKKAIINTGFPNPEKWYKNDLEFSPRVAVKIMDTLNFIKDQEIIHLRGGTESLVNNENVNCEIIVGGVIISRGYTFEYLTTQIMINAPQTNLSMDTMLQRARWFGYRNKNKKISILMNHDLADFYKKCERFINKFNDLCFEFNISKNKEVFKDFNKQISNENVKTTGVKYGK